MSAPIPYLEGRFDHKMDPKFRVSVPSDWRTESGEVLRLLLSESYKLPVIKVLTEREYERRLAEIENTVELNPAQKRALRGRLHLNCRTAVVNPQGKLLVPKDWSEKAGLEADATVVLAGRGDFFEVWNPVNFDQMVAAEIAETDAINVNLDIF